MSISNNIYNILGKLKSITNTESPEADTTSTEVVYESVEARGDIMEAVRSLESKFETFKEAKKAKPDFLDVDKDGDKAEPFKKAVKDKKKTVKEGQGPYELYNPKHPKFKANYEKYKAKNPGCKLEDFINAMKAREAKMNEAAYDEPAAPDAAAIERRKRLQALKDKREEEGHGDDAVNTPIRKVAGKAYGGSAQKDAPETDDLEEAGYSAKKARAGKDIGKPGKNFAKIAKGAAERYGSKERGEKVAGAVLAKLRANESESCVDEVAPPGAKAERMVKHIKKGYAKDGKLTKKEKGIAYATAWKAKKAGVVEGTEFKDAGKIKNSAPDMKKAKLAKVTEGRVMEETDYFYEKIGKALAEQNPHLDTATGEFVDAVRKEMVAQGIPPNRARGIIMQDEDFISDVATSYGHYCTVDARHPLPAEIDLDNVKELDEIAALAGLARAAAPAIAGAVSNLSDSDEMEEDTMGAVMGGIAGGMVGKTPGAVATGAKLGSAARDAFNSATGLDEITAPPRAVPSGKKSKFDPSTLKAPDAKPLRPMADTRRLLAPADSVSEDEMAEGNEFTKARLDAIAAGKDTFTVGSKTYKVAGDTSQEKVQVAEDATITVSATLEDDALNLMRKLAGMSEKESEVELRDVPDAEELGLEEDRDIEWDNTPEEDVAPLSASIPSGNDLHKSKRQDPATANKAANPLKDDNKVAESLWKAYEDMINDVKK